MCEAVDERGFLGVGDAGSWGARGASSIIGWTNVESGEMIEM